MDELYAINVAKSEFRDCFNLGDASRVLAIVAPDLMSFSDGQPSEFGASGFRYLEDSTRELIRTLHSETGRHRH